MIFYCDLQGNLKAFQNETVYQGSNNVTTIYVVAPFNRPVGLNISFTKPNKLVTSPAIMKWVGTLGNLKIPVSFVNIPEQFTETYNVWAYALPYSITEQNGVVGVSVNAVIADSVDASGQQAYKGNLTTFTGQFTVAYSALPSPPTDIPTEWTQDKVLDLLNNYYNDAIQKIGEMNTLKTNAKDTLVKAINEVFDEIASTNATIGDLSTLTTDEKTTIVGAINEVDNHADTAQQTADNATVLANTGISKAEQAQATANNAVATANGAKTIAEQAKTIATNSVYSVSFEDIQSAVTALNGYDNAYFKVGNSIYLKQKDVPDMWVYAVASEYVEYTYTTDDDFVNALLLGTVQVGYYVLANLESTGDYDVLKNKPIINQDLSTDGFAPVENTYYRHTGTTSETYTAGVIYFYNGTAYKAIDGAGGEVPTSLPVSYKKASGELPTSGWSTLDEGWKGNTLPAKSDWRRVAYGNGKFVAVTDGTGRCAYSTDGISWNETSLPTSRRWFGVTYGDGKFVAVALSTDKGAYSTDGINWNEFTLPASQGWHSVTYGNGKFVAVADSSTGAYSTDGITWTAMTLPTSQGWYGVTYGDGKFVAVAANSDKGAYSTDGITWTEMSMPENAGWFSVVYGNGKFVAITQGLTIAAYSLNGTAWSKITLPISASEGIAYGDGKFVVVPDNSNYGAYSTDGINWAKMSMPTSQKWRYVTYGNGKFVAVAMSSTGAYWKAAAQVTYSISDTFITANTAVKMYLTDEGGVKAQSKANGSITVIRDTVPTTTIPYEYEVEQTSAEGLFEVVNSYVPTIPETPTALPQTAGALKSGNLPTSGWGVSASLWTGSEVMPYNPGYIGNIGKTWASSSDELAELPNGWQATMNGVLYSNRTAKLDGDSPTRGIQFGITGTGVGADEAFVRIYTNGDIYVWNNKSSVTRTITQIGCSLLSKQTYTISDTTITANSDILMELTDEGGVKAYSMEAGKMTVIRDTVPTQPIPYTYKVKQTNASGQFTVINHYVPKVEIPTIPTKTSELINDSGFVSNLPIVRNVVCNDVESATTLDTTITCEVGDLILAQIIVRSALTLPTGWSLLRTIPAVETSTNQTLSFAYKRATSTSETLTVTQATAGRIYTNLVRLSNATSISYIQSCEKTGTGIKSISSTKPVTPNMVIWGASSSTWKTSSPYGNWTYSPSTLDYYSLPQSTIAPRLGTFVDSSGTGERTFTIPNDTSNVIMCGAVEIVGDEVARKGDIPSATTLYEDSTGAATVTLSETINNGDIVRIKTNNGNVDHYYIGVAWNHVIAVTESSTVTDESDVTVGTAINIYSLRFHIQDTSLILYHYFKTNITTAGAVTITNEKANVVIRKVERIHT